jgi:hypothetical protein
MLGFLRKIVLKLCPIIRWFQSQLLFIAVSLLHANQLEKFIQFPFFLSDLQFTRTGHFEAKPEPYCIVFQAREVIRGRTMVENATVCIFTPEPVPVPMSLRDDRNRKTKKFSSNPASSEQLKVSSPVDFVLEYPGKVEVLQNASIYARVVEPVKPINDKQNK